MLMFEDWNGNLWLCIPKNQRARILGETHDEPAGVAHVRYQKTYNKLASVYYWPRMSRDVKRFVVSCNICQKVKHKRHTPVGLLQPIPILG